MSSSHHLHSHTMFDQPTECHWEPSWHCQQVPRPSLHRKGSRARKLRAPSPAARQLLPVLHLQCLLGAQPHLGFLTAYAALVHLVQTQSPGKKSRYILGPKLFHADSTEYELLGPAAPGTKAARGPTHPLGSQVLSWNHTDTPVPWVSTWGILVISSSTPTSFVKYS